MTMTDLPARPAPDAEAHRIVEATERVKSVSDKTDPRFEAALNKVDREAARRAKADSAQTGSKKKTKKDGHLDDEESDEATSGTEARTDRPVRPSSTSFSFNSTDDDEDQADTEDVQ